MGLIDREVKVCTVSIMWRLDVEIPAWFMRKAGKGICGV